MVQESNPTVLPREGQAGSQPSYESLDCMSPSWTQRVPSHNPFLTLGMSKPPGFRFKPKTALVWAVAFGIGVCTALVALLIAAAVGNISGVRLHLVFQATDQGLPTLRTFLCYSALNLLLVLLAACMVLFVGPAAAGSGIPDVKAYLNAVDTRGTLSLRTFLAKVLGITFAVSGGLPVGKEGPLVHIGACLASAFGSRNGPRCWRGIKQLKYFRNDKDRMDLVTLGAACGVAAAFKAPVGGLLFVLEEAASWWRAALMWRVFFACTVTAVAMDAGSKWCHAGATNPCGFFNGGGLVLFQSDFAEKFELAALLPAAGLGVVGGAAGAAFVYVNSMLCRWRKRHISGRRSRCLVEACAVSVLTSVLVFFLPVSVAKCKECLDSDYCPPGSPQFSRFVRWHCHTGNAYNDLAVLMFNPQDEAIRALFESPAGSFCSASLCLFGVYYFVLAIITYGVAVPSGLFVPSMLIGATLGRLYSHALVLLGALHNPNEGLWALLGAAAYMGGVMRLLPSLCIILLEITGSLTQLPLIMLVLTVAKTVGDVFTRSIYDEHMVLKGIPFLEPRLERKEARRLVAGDVATRPVVSFQQVERASAVQKLLRSTRHNAFPVVQPSSHGDVLVGVVSRQKVKDVLAALPKGQSESFQFHDASNRTLSRSNSSSSLSENNASETGHVVEWTTLDSQHQSVASLGNTHSQNDECLVDLRAHMQPAPYVVYNSTPLKQTYQLFRTMGLRHLSVVTPNGNLVGILTRKSFLLNLHDQIERDLQPVLTSDEPDEGVRALTPAALFRRFQSAIRTYGSNGLLRVPFAQRMQGLADDDEYSPIQVED